MFAIRLILFLTSISHFGMDSAHANPREELRYFFLARMMLDNLGWLEDKHKITPEEIQQLQIDHPDLWKYVRRKQIGTGDAAAQFIGNELKLDPLTRQWLAYGLYKVNHPNQKRKEIVDLSRKALMILALSSDSRAQKIFDLIKSHLFPTNDRKGLGLNRIREQWNKSNKENIPLDEFYIEWRSARAYFELAWWQSVSSTGESFAQRAIELKSDSTQNLSVEDISNNLKVDPILVYDFLLDQGLVDAPPTDQAHAALLDRVNKYFDKHLDTALKKLNLILPEEEKNLVSLRGLDEPTLHNLLTTLITHLPRFSLRLGGVALFHNLFSQPSEVIFGGYRNVSFPTVLSDIGEVLDRNTKPQDTAPLDSALSKLERQPSWKTTMHVSVAKGTSTSEVTSNGTSPVTSVPVSKLGRPKASKSPTQTPIVITSHPNDKIIQKVLLDYIESLSSDEPLTFGDYIEELYASERPGTSLEGYYGSINSLITETFKFIQMLNRQAADQEEKKKLTSPKLKIIAHKFNLLLDISILRLEGLDWNDPFITEILAGASRKIRKEILQIWLARVLVGEDPSREFKKKSDEYQTIAFYPYQIVIPEMLQYHPIGRFVSELPKEFTRVRPMKISTDQLFGEGKFSIHDRFHRFRVFDSFSVATSALLLTIREMVASAQRAHVPPNPILLEASVKKGLDIRPFKNIRFPVKFDYKPNSCFKAMCESCIELVERSL